MPLSPVPHVRGLVLAAGSGSRMGRPKALVMVHGETLVERAIRTLDEGGCDGVTVVVGAAADDVRAALTRVSAASPPPPSRVSAAPAPPPSRVSAASAPGSVDVVECVDWSEGMGASLRAGLSALTAAQAVDAVLVMLVDLPDLSPAVVRRLLSHETQRTRLVCSRSGPGAGARTLTAALSRAAYDGVPGHPALVGRAHWEGVVAMARGDRGARDYFATRPHDLVECGDLATGRDVDTPADLDT